MRKYRPEQPTLVKVKNPFEGKTATQVLEAMKEREKIKLAEGNHTFTPTVTTHGIKALILMKKKK